MLMRSILILPLVLVWACSSEPRDRLGDPKGEQYLVRGRSLVRGLAACGYCHAQRPEPTSLFSGGRPFFDKYGEVRAPNLTPGAGGIGAWSTEDIMAAVRSSMRPDGERLSKEAHAGYEWIADEDLLSIIAYLRTLPPIANEVPRRKISFWKRNTTGFMESHDELRGFVPAIDRSRQGEYGRYLVDHVARCGACHNKRGGLLAGDEYLGGGEQIKAGEEEKFAPAINGSSSEGLGDWSAGDIVHYLKTGETPDGRRSDPAFCPWNFYQNADDCLLYTSPSPRDS